ncbi:MAG: hypothetical protein KC613_08925 [Myxococcales bacterium]|nr:hypothetical protein [Myxococcales bacterium]MCB9525085.1 hypothetical protein [Myxococcales bacterium]
MLQVFGLPTAVADRVRWMGQYHSRFSDLPTSLAAELLRPWDRPPVSETPARIWVLLGRASVGLRRRSAAVAGLVAQASVLATRAEPSAQVELALVQAFCWARSDAAGCSRALAEAERLLCDDGAQMDSADRVNLHARWVDQVAYPLNRPGAGARDHTAAADLYRSIPAEGPLFAQCRRANGLGWSLLKLGDRAGAEVEARRSVAAAGDLGSLRLRAMALNLLGAATDGEVSAAAKARAQGIAARLEDEALRLRFDPQRRRQSM